MFRPTRKLVDIFAVVIYLGLLTVCCGRNSGGEQVGSDGWDLPPYLPLAMGGMLLLLLVGSAWWTRRRGEPVELSRGVMLGMLLLSAAVNAGCNLAMLWDIGQTSVSFFLFLAVACILWALLRRFSLLIWFPFFALEIAQIAGYYQYGTRVNSLVIAETLEASHDEVFAYLSPENMLIAAASLIGAGILCWLLTGVMRRVQHRLTLVNTALFFALFSLLCAVYVKPSRRNVNFFWPCYESYLLCNAWGEAIFHNQATIRQVESLPSPTVLPSSLNTLSGGEGVVLVVHIGESVRADRMSVNGYERDTTPWLRSCPRLINFSDCISAACDTCQAQIAILTDARRDVYEKDPALQPHTGSVLDLFAAHGFKVYSFFGKRNATHLKYDLVVRLLTRCDEQRFHAPGSPWTSVPQMAELLRSVPSSQNIVLFINNEGSHTPFSHYDRLHTPFQPAGSTFGKPASHALEVNNAYDSTVHYTDEFVRRVTRLLRGRPWIYLYVSDHGEYLGHDGIWGRGGLGESGRSYHSTTGCRVGMFILTSPELEALHPHFAESIRELKSHTDMRIGQEHIFHTLLGFFDLRTPWYNPALDLCSPSPQPYSGEHPGEP